MITEEQYLIATERVDDEAHYWIQYTFEDSWRDTGMTFKELRQYINLRDNNWYIEPGETYRYYKFDGEEVTESLPMMEVCIRLELYPPQGLDQLDDWPEELK